MFCTNGTLYLEEQKYAWNVTELRNNSTFCNTAFNIVEYTSLPLGVLIVVINLSVLKALRHIYANALHGNGCILSAIALLDVGNGVFCFIYFYEAALGLFNYGDPVAWGIIVWISWWLIYTAWLLKLYLCIYRIYSYVRILCFPVDTFTFWQMSKRRAKWTILIICALGNLELVSIYLCKIYQDQVRNTFHISVFPFLGFQTALVIIISGVTAVLMVFSKLKSYTTQANLTFAANSLIMFCISTLVTNSLTFYGDMVCVFDSNSTHLMYMKPECFIPLAKEITYFDSLIFPIILFRGKLMQKALCR